MIRALHSELIKLWRRRTVAIAVAVVAVYSIGSTSLILSGAGPAGPVEGPGPSLDSLSGAGGGTEIFTGGLAFAGFFVLVVFIGAMANEFARGNVRTMLLRQPDRLRLLGGKLAALLLSAAVLLAAAELLTWVTAAIMAPAQDVDTAAWRSPAAIGHALADYATAMYWVTGYALLGTALAMLVRSVPVALAIGIAWAGPFEHIVADSWDTAVAVFPGLLLETVVAGGRESVSMSQALATSAGYGLLAAAVAAVSFLRRDAV